MKPSDPPTRPHSLDIEWHAETDVPNDDGVGTRLRHNFIVLTIYQVVMRLGWIFKTESIIMPAVLDSIGGTATLRGLLPTLSRFAMAIPPVIAAPWLRRAPLKKKTLAKLTLLMGISFLLLASCWLVPTPLLGNSFPLLFLAIYTVFFIFSGLNQLSFGTLQGKAIPATLRGRLMLAANTLGAAVAISAAFLLMPRWLNQEGGDFQYVFGFAGLCFVISAGAALATRESPDTAEASSAGHRLDGFSRVFAALREDRSLRRVALMSALGNCCIMLFPHYQALARERMDANFASLIVWIAVQNFGTALFSLIAGWIADRLGNRIVLHAITAGLASVPLLALAISRSSFAPSAFCAVFFLIGLTPVFLRIVQHYTLELAAPIDHPRYLAAIAICNAIPFLLSALVGYLVDAIGYEAVFFGVTTTILASFALTFRLSEPRTE